MTEKDEQKAQGCCGLCAGDNKVWIVGLLGLLVGMLVMYLAMPAFLPAQEGGGPQMQPPGQGEEFELDEAKAQEIGSLLSDTYLVNTGSEVEVSFIRYEDESSHLVLYYNVSGQEMPVYASKDYAYLYPGAIDYQEMAEAVAEAKAAYLAAGPANDSTGGGADQGYPLAETPEVFLFVMSNCPYGNLAENAIVDVVSMLEADISFEPVYIIYDESVHSSYGADNPECLSNEGETYCSMHGMYELAQGIREKMVYDRYGAAKWAEFATQVNAQCFAVDKTTIDTCWKDVAEGLEINVTDIEENFEAEKFTILAREKELTFGMNQLGSPSLVINGQEYSGSRTPEGYKDAICSSFETEPGDCALELSDSEGQASGSCG